MVFGSSDHHHHHHHHLWITGPNAVVLLEFIRLFSQCLFDAYSTTQFNRTLSAPRCQAS